MISFIPSWPQYSHLNKFEQHSAQNATNILMRISIWIQLSTYKVSCDVTNAMTSYQLTLTYLKKKALKFFQIDPFKSITEIL